MTDHADLIARARHAYEHGGGDRLHLELADALESAAADQMRPLPAVAYKGPYDTDAAIFERVARNLEQGYPVGGSNVRDALVRLIRREIAADRLRALADETGRGGGA